MVLGLLLSCSAFAQTGKPRVAIPELEDKAGAGTHITSALLDMLTTAIVQSGKFDVVERARLNQVFDEQALGASGAVEGGSAAPMGRLKGADYMLIGTVTECGMGSRTTRVYDSTIKKNSATLAIDIRFTDSTTGTNLFADTFRATHQNVDVAGSGSVIDVSTGVGSSLAREVVEGIVSRTLHTAYPPRIIEIAEGVATINYGESLCTLGDVWEVYAQGKRIIDPDTGEDLGSDEKRVGSIRITEVFPKYSKGKVESGEEVTAGAVLRKGVSSDSSPKVEVREKPNPF
ncbi:MAG: hypothetical protein HYV27_19360 [Candidatus Hydrogenedentes bacterium]|nr:hypothetical protein [Candidatus Hydrogenedentota bacterium]